MDAKRHLERRKRLAYQWLVPLGMAICCALIADLATARVAWLNGLEALGFQNLQARRASSNPRKDIILIAIEEKTFPALGYSPDLSALPRIEHANLVRRLRSVGASVVVLDVGFFEERKEDPDLAAALKEPGDMAITLATVPIDDQTVPDDNEPDGYRRPFAPVVVAPDGGSGNVAVASALGFKPDADIIGAILWRNDARTGKHIAHVSLSAALQHSRVTFDDVRLDAGSHLLTAGPLEWRLDDNDDLLAHWTDSPNDFPKVEFSQAVKDLRSSSTSGKYSNKIVIVGDARPKEDVVLTPKFGAVHGIDFLAQMINTVLLSQGQRATTLSSTIDRCWWVVLGLLAACSVVSLRPLMAAAGVVGAFILAWLAPLIISSGLRMQPETVSPLLTVGLSFVCASVLVAWRGREVDFRPAGLQEEATIMFLDLRDSTPIVRALGAEVYQRLMSNMNQAMHRIIEGAGGHIERTTGDGLLAVFRDTGGTHHALRCVLTIRPLCEAVEKLAERSQSDHGIDLTVTIGLETGILSGGYVHEGGHRVWSSAGPAINLAQRLQSACSKLDVDVAIGPVAAGLIGQDLPMQELGKLELKGFSQPVTAYTLVVATSATLLEERL